MKLLFELATFTVPLLFKEPYFFEAVIYFFARDTFSEDVAFLNSWFSTANLAFTIKISIDHLVTNPTNTGDFRFKLRGDAQNGALLRKSFH